MKKLALAFSSKDRPDLSQQSLMRICGCRYDALFWLDGSRTEAGLKFFDGNRACADVAIENATGGPDRTIVRALTDMLYPRDYDYVGLVENDVLLDPDWLESTMVLFDNPDGLPVGAVSARSYEDRVLIQRDGYCVLHNAGAGMILFTREAASIILQNYRTGWWPENRATFSQLSGIDIGKFAAFHHNEQMITADWSFDTILAAHGLATVALTPSKASMIGQVPSLAEQGLALTQSDVEARRDDAAFHQFRGNLMNIRSGHFKLPPVDHLLRTRGGAVIFPHHADKHGGVFRGNWTTRWNQGCGPFTYVAGNNASFSIPLFGPCAFHVAGGAVKLSDAATGFQTELDLSGHAETVTMVVPRDMQTGIVRLEFGPGACLAGIEVTQPQVTWTGSTFDYSKLPETA